MEIISKIIIIGEIINKIYDETILKVKIIKKLIILKKT